eukprot:gnl/MRDRNA2_/MRDRNA2_85651_c0_seq3.p1 gnl/MRDRNA2_/MRDRNA2_85651_c0~~gnl/MRDRNA2_/MRDRNA2_85651_c0_seq3.p1  ORF type:complete len:410 (+),score=29.98 gnl/MRDRNA2_/MRDRNA2_85651_c0_seq3:1-1230(+)
MFYGAFPALAQAIVCSILLTVICEVHGAAVRDSPFAHQHALQGGGRSGWQRWPANLCFIFLMAMLVRGIWLDLSAYKTPRLASKTTKAKQTELSAILRVGFISAAAFYAFGLPMLGLIDFGACHMFANLKLHGGSNHAFLPTGLLQRWLALESPLTHWAGGFAGGEVRVEFTNSRWINGNFPGEIATGLTPEPYLRTRLSANGYVSRFFSPAMSPRMHGVIGWTKDITPEEFTSMASNMSHMFPWEAGKLVNGNKQHYDSRQAALAGNSTTLIGGAFMRYNLPANELRVLLEGARWLGESFVLNYTQIRENKGVPPGDCGGLLDEAWRANGCGRAVTLHEEVTKGAGSSQRKVTCQVRDTCAGESSTILPCAADDIALLPPTGYWPKKLVYSNPYVILDPPGRYCGGGG